MLYLGVTLIDAGRYQDAVNEMLDAAADAHLTGLDRSFGGYLDALAAEGLLRLGRWSEAETVLERSDGAQTLPVGRIRLARSGAMLAARRGDRERAASLLADAEQEPVDPFHRTFLDDAAADVHIVLGDWAEAAAIAGRALSGDVTRRPVVADPVRAVRGDRPGRARVGRPRPARGPRRGGGD